MEVSAPVLNGVTFICYREWLGRTPCHPNAPSAHLCPSCKWRRASDVVAGVTLQGERIVGE